MQRTLKSAAQFNGIGLHSGTPVRMVVNPAAIENGIWFKRVDISDADNMLPARWDYVEQSPLCTKLVNDAGIQISTIEHIMAALSGCGIHNALVELNGPEVPIMDGSSVEFVEAFLKAGVVDQSAPVRAIRVLKSVSVDVKGAQARLDPADSLKMEFEIDFADKAIGVQSRSLNMANGAFVHTLCDSRTFCSNSDVSNLKAQGLVQGGTLENAIVFDGNQILSPGGLRHSDEPVRHKLLDAVGDLALAGAPLLASYTASKAGHSVTNTLLRALFADPSNFEMIECGEDQMANLPGSGVTRADVPVLA